MSIVCCKITDKEITIASDSIVVRGDTQDKQTNNHAKLFEVNNMVIGSTGYCEETSMFRLYCISRQPASASEGDILSFISEFARWKKERTDKYSIDNQYIIVYQKKVFSIFSFFVDQVLSYQAIGAGSDYALAALYLGHSVKEAVDTSCELSIYCEKPVIHFTIPLE